MVNVGNKSIRNIILGFLSYYISSNVLILYLPRTICAVLDLLAIVLVCKAYIMMPKRKIDADFDFKLVYYFFFIWGILIAVRGLLSYNSLIEMKEVVSNSEVFLTYLLPLLYFLKVDKVFFYYLKKIGIFCLGIGFVFFILNINDLFLNAQTFYSELVTADVDDKYLLLGRCNVQMALLFPLFLFYIGGTFRRKEQLAFLFSFMLATISIAYAGRRGGLFTAVLYLLSTYFCKIKFKNLLLLVVLVLIVYFYGLNFLENTFSVLGDRLYDDTRSWAEKELYKGMDSTDWIIGKGSTGTFYSPYFGTQRNVIETGYLHLALKGGIFYSAAWCYILVTSFIKGFLAKSKMVKVLSLYILPFIPGMYLFGHPVWDMSYLVLWICIIFCNSPKYRNSNISFLYDKNVFEF